MTRSPTKTHTASVYARLEATVNAWLLELSGNTIDLATVKAWAGAVPVVGNIVALFDALGDIIHLAKTGSNDPLDWVSLGINLIGVVPVPPTMAAARMTLRPVLFLARQQLKKNKGDFAQAVMNIMVGHLSATLMGEIETFVERAETELPGILNNAANTGFQTLNSLADAIERIAKGEIDTTQQRKAIINSAQAIYAPIEEPSLWDLLTRAEAVISATAGAVQYTRPDGSAVHHAYDDLDQRFKTRDAVVHFDKQNVTATSRSVPVQAESQKIWTNAEAYKLGKLMSSTAGILLGKT